jgi:glycosyltransferase involved in cell wall biosynthesis
MTVDTTGATHARREPGGADVFSFIPGLAVARGRHVEHSESNIEAVEMCSRATQTGVARSANTFVARRPKVLFANKFFFAKGGAEAVFLDEIALMRSYGVGVAEFSMQDPRNLPSAYERYFVSNKDYRTGSTSQKIKSAASFVHSREAVRKIRRLILDEKPDILHCHNVYHQLTPSIINAAAQLKTRVVLTLHDYKPVCPVYTQLQNGKPCTECSNGRFEAVLRHRCAGGSLAQSALLWAEARVHSALGSYQRVDKFIAPSRFMRDAVIGRLGYDKVVYIPNGIDSSRIEISDDDDGYVLFLGRLAPEKGVETLLRAHAADGGAWRLVIAGTGPLLDELQSRYPLAEFTGHLSGNQLTKVLRNASVIAVPSEWHENNPLSILEAMGHGKPVIASRIGGIPELVRHGVTGLLSTPGEPAELSAHIELLLADRELRKRFGRQAREVVEREYSLQQHGAALLSLYESLMPVRNVEAC